MTTKTARRTFEFFVVREKGGYVLMHASGDLFLATQFADKTAAADAAIRFAQDQGALYSIHY